MNPTLRVSLVAGCIACLVAQAVAHSANAAPPVQLARDGRPQAVLVAGNVAEPVAELEKYLQRIVGRPFPQGQGRQSGAAVYVGLAADFPW
ncbi:MAG: hypothetical protein KDA41_22260, partial [Planctomycetales bacterium]|nr:hypothetical protein [Planctomycetales bacterium]